MTYAALLLERQTIFYRGRLHPRIDFQKPGSSIVVAPTALGPIAGMPDESFFYGISVHVVEFFPQLLCAPHIEIIEPPLPERRASRCLAMFASRDSLSYTDEEIAEYERQEKEISPSKPNKPRTNLGRSDR